ncbi:MAG: hypothetical protein J0I06_19435 [Planctomycetes bacterium]|nr:hypothetical protein [Planctomycetota bacterium]
MRTLVSLALLVALAGSHAGGKAPVPKDAPPPSIEGKYTLLSMSGPDDRNGGGGGFGGVAGPGGGVVRIRTSPASLYMTGPATITKNTITLDGRGVISPLAGAGGPTTMEYTLDATKTPMTIDVSLISLRGKKTKVLGLAEVVGDRLVIAIAKEGDDRPKSTEENGDVTVYYFQKAPPPPKVEFKVIAMTAGKEGDAEKELNRLAGEGYELVSTTNPIATGDKAAPTIIHFVLKRTTK